MAQKNLIKFFEFVNKDDKLKEDFKKVVSVLKDENVSPEKVSDTKRKIVSLGKKYGFNFTENEFVDSLKEASKLSLSDIDNVAGGVGRRTAALTLLAVSTAGLGSGALIHHFISKNSDSKPAQVANTETDNKEENKAKEQADNNETQVDENQVIDMDNIKLELGKKRTPNKNNPFKKINLPSFDISSRKPSTPVTKSEGAGATDLTTTPITGASETKKDATTATLKKEVQTPMMKAGVDQSETQDALKDRKEAVKKNLKEFRKDRYFKDHLGDDEGDDIVKTFMELNKLDNVDGLDEKALKDLEGKVEFVKKYIYADKEEARLDDKIGYYGIGEYTDGDFNKELSELLEMYDYYGNNVGGHEVDKRINMIEDMNKKLESLKDKYPRDLQKERAKGVEFREKLSLVREFLLGLDNIGEQAFLSKVQKDIGGYSNYLHLTGQFDAMPIDMRGHRAVIEFYAKLAEQYGRARDYGKVLDKLEERKENTDEEKKALADAKAGYSEVQQICNQLEKIDDKGLEKLKTGLDTVRDIIVAQQGFNDVWNQTVKPKEGIPNANKDPLKDRKEEVSTKLDKIKVAKDQLEGIIDDDKDVGEMLAGLLALDDVNDLEEGKLKEVEEKIKFMEKLLNVDELADTLDGMIEKMENLQEKTPDMANKVDALRERFDKASERPVKEVDDTLKELEAIQKEIGEIPYGKKMIERKEEQARQTNALEKLKKEYESAVADGDIDYEGLEDLKDDIQNKIDQLDDEDENDAVLIEELEELIAQIDEVLEEDHDGSGSGSGDDDLFQKSSLDSSGSGSGSGSGTSSSSSSSTSTSSEEDNHRAPHILDTDASSSEDDLFNSGNEID